MMAVGFKSFECCCGARTIDGVSSTIPEKVIHAYLTTQQGGLKFDLATKSYVKNRGLNIRDAFVLWADQDRPIKHPINDGWGSKSSGKLLCEYIQRHRLGSVTKTPLRHNPMHSERKPGHLDLRIWIWNVNPAACQRWWDRHKPVEPPHKNVGAPIVRIGANARKPKDIKDATVNAPVARPDDIPF